MGNLKIRRNRQIWLENRLDELWMKEIVGKCEYMALLPLLEHRLQNEAERFAKDKKSLIPGLVEECLSITQDKLFAEPKLAAENLQAFLATPKGVEVLPAWWQVTNFVIMRLAAITGCERREIESCLDGEADLLETLMPHIANYKTRRIGPNDALFLCRRLLEPERVRELTKRADIWVQSMPQIKGPRFDRWRAIAHYHETRRIEEETWPELMAAPDKNVRLLVLDIASRKTAQKKNGRAASL